MNRKSFHTVLTLFLTFVSTFSMLYISKSDYEEDSYYVQRPINAIDFESREYLGYIFEDYNKPVNLNYLDKNIVDKNEKEDFEDITISVMNMEYTKENIRGLRSERIIEERASK